MYFIYKAHRSFKEFKDKYKENYIIEIIGNSFKDVKFEYEDGLSKFEVNVQGLVNLPDKFVSKNYIEGKYKSINIRSSSISMKKRRQGGIRQIAKGMMNISREMDCV